VVREARRGRGSPAAIIPTLVRGLLLPEGERLPGSVHDAVPDGVAHQIGGGMEVEFVDNVLAVAFDRVGA